MATKPMTRAQMKRAAMAFSACDKLAPSTCYKVAARMFGVPKSELNCDSPRSKWAEKHGLCLVSWDDEEASMLLSEAHRPAGHDGDGTDEL